MEKEKICGIYKITSPSGKVYIGESKDIEQRKKSYKNVGKGIKNQRRLYNSILKHGWEAHIFEIIEECVYEELLCKERYWQDFYDVTGENGLNCKLTTCGEQKAEISQETKNIWSFQRKGKKLSEEHIQKIKDIHISKKEGYVSHFKGKSYNKGIPKTQEQKDKISKTRLERRLGKLCDNPTKKSVINVCTMEVLCCAKILSHVLDMNYQTLMNMLSLSSPNPNKTEWVLLENYEKGILNNNETAKKDFKKKVINIIDKVIYESIKEVSVKFNIPYNRLYSHLSGVVENKTKFMYLEQYIKLNPDFKYE